MLKNNFAVTIMHAPLHRCKCLDSLGFGHSLCRFRADSVRTDVDSVWTDTDSVRTDTDSAQTYADSVWNCLQIHLLGTQWSDSTWTNAESVQNVWSPRGVHKDTWGRVNYWVSPTGREAMGPSMIDGVPYWQTSYGPIHDRWSSPLADIVWAHP